ncbi:hypothetical protein C4552_02005, partial [Candidatus Parcubacteria bacterium]
KRSFQRAVNHEPTILWGHYQLARIYFVEGNYARALEEANLELEGNPENLRALYVRGLVHAYRNELGQATDDFTRFTAWAPKEWAGYNDLAWVLSKAGQDEAARDTVLRALQEIPDASKNPWLWNALGVAELNLKQYPRAHAAFQNAQNLAAGLSEADWRRAYSGNHPAQAASGLAAFRAAIDENLRRSSNAAQ